MATSLEAVKHSLAFLPRLPPSPSDLARLAFPSHHELPEPLRALPSIFRLLAFSIILPVLALTLIDVVGWVFFKLLLRPLGYASTVRFKDPEPPTMLVPAPGAVDNSNSSIVHSSHAALVPSTSSSSSGASSSGASESSSAPSSPETSTRPELHAAPAVPIVSSATSRPHRSPSRQSRSHAHSSSSSSTGSASSSSGGDTLTRRMSRNRAPSVGLDGPLLGDGETTDGMATPGGESSEAESEAGADYLSAGAKERRGDGVPRGGFKLGLTEVRRREAVGGGGGE
ncbi:hypothetical protein JCM10207_001732 [Rhodosporidiobolus poonsookiae]